MTAILQSRVEELELLIQQARHSYYNGNPTTSDEVFDAWVDELSELKADSTALTAIGAPVPVSAWKKAAHGITMGSLDKVNTPEELTEWIRQFSPNGSEMLLVTEKLDGISVHVKYEQGAFCQAITRGDGLQGEDISQNVVRMQGILGRLPEGFTGSLRGEIILTKADHAKHFPTYSNTRNAASGISKRYDGQGSEFLSILFYEVADGKNFEIESDVFEWLTAMGLKTPNWYVTAMVPGIKTPHDLWVEYQQSKRAALGYDIDGLVVRINNREKQLSLGDHDGRPRGAKAFKFAPITRETVLRSVEWQVGGAGRITPVAVFDPVRLLGAEVTNASLYNLKYIEDLGLTVGSRVIIARANDVIPRVVSVVVRAPGVFEPPKVCSSCGADVARDGEYLTCPNVAECPAQAVGRIKRYLQVLDVKEWGDTLIERLVTSGKVKTPVNLYKLNIPSLSEVERISENVADKLLILLWEKTELPLETLLGSLSIPLCGPTMITLVMEGGYDTWDKMMAAGPIDFEKVPGFGPVKGSTLYHWIANSGKKLVAELLSAGMKVRPRVKGVFTGMSFCFTGKTVRKRSELEALVTDRGGVVKTSVGKGLTYLVMSDPTSASTKAQAAKKNGTTCISEDDLVAKANV